MTALITVNDVTAFISSGLPSQVIAGYIAFVDQADVCLDSNGVSDEIQEALKLNAIAHMITLSNGTSGEVTSETSRTGASVTYKQSSSGNGLGATSYGRVLQQLDANGCLTSLFKKPRFFNSIGPRL